LQFIEEDNNNSKRSSFVISYFLLFIVKNEIRTTSIEMSEYTINPKSSLADQSAKKNEKERKKEIL